MGQSAALAQLMRVLSWSLAMVSLGQIVTPRITAQQPDTSRRRTVALELAIPVADPRAVQPERPTVATHAGTVAPGFIEIETGVERDRFDPSAISVFTPTVVKVGVGSHAQLNVSGSIARPPGGTIGVGDIGAGMKLRLADDAPVVGNFAVLPSIKLPTGSVAAGRGTGTTDLSLLLISSHELGDVAMDLNVGYTRRSGDGSAAPRDATLWTASFGGGAIGRLGWVAELYGYPATNGPSGQASIVAVLAGPTYLLRSWLAFDTGLIVPLTGPQPHALYAGAVYNAGHLWHAGRLRH
jgi:outer membrane putative beta-barrel porin/alpha-amylase